MTKCSEKYNLFRGSSIKYIYKISQKTMISCPLIYTYVYVSGGEKY